MGSEADNTEVGSYFVANYPPFSVWSQDQADTALDVLGRPGEQAVPLGLYLHIPFCRKRCKFCYFKVYTERNSDDVERYLAALAKEISLYAGRPGIAGREFDFVYFGGGTPSYLSRGQLLALVDRIGHHWSWDSAREVTFECEPGTVKRSKLEGIKEIGVTRLSLGVEHFDDDVLELNGRAHRSPEIPVVFEMAREVGFDQINVDLIAGMVGETDEKWRTTVEKTLELDPDSVTIYQMELPFNAVFSKESLSEGVTPVAGWDAKRAWLDEAFSEFEKAGYELSSAYTVVKKRPDGVPAKFAYRDSLWRGADLIGTGVASFSHLAGVHFQNMDRWDDYLALIDAGRLPVQRALRTTSEQRLIREMILQLKLGRIDASYFRSKFGVEIFEKFSDAYESLIEVDFARIEGDVVTLTRKGLLRVDSLLPRFFEPQYRDIRYT